MKSLITTVLVCLVTATAAQMMNRQPVSIPIMFTENAGQWRKDILFGTLHGADAAMFLKRGIVLRSGFAQAAHGSRGPEQLPSPSQKYTSLTFVNPSSSLEVGADGKLDCRSNFYHGNDESFWREGVQNYSKISYRNAWRRVDVEYAERNGKMLQQFVVHPGGRVSDIRLKAESGDNAAGFRITRAYKDDDSAGEVIPIVLNRRTDGITSFSNSLRSYATRLIIETEFCSLFGGSGGEFEFSNSSHSMGYISFPQISVDDAGIIYLKGITSSLDLPVLNASQNRHGGGDADCFVAKFLCDGRTLAYCTYLGGSSPEGCSNVPYHTGEESMLCTQKGLYIVGWTSSNDYPVTANGVQRTNKGVQVHPARSEPAWNGFITRFNSSGAITASTYLGGPGETSADNITTDRRGNLYVTGRIYDSLWCITKGVVQPFLKFKWSKDHDGSAGYIAKLSADCDSIMYASYLLAVDGNNVDAKPTNFMNLAPLQIIVDSMEQAIIIGASSFNERIPIVGARQTIHGGGYDAYMTKLNRTATGYIYSSWFGGSGSEHRINVMKDVSDNFYLGGATWSKDFPLERPLRTSYSPTIGNSGTGFLSKFSSAGDLLFSTYWLGSDSESVRSMAIDRCGNLLILGNTTSSRFPMVRPIDSTLTSVPNTISAIDPSLSSIVFSSFLSDGLGGFVDMRAGNVPGYVNLVGFASHSDTSFGYHLYNAYQSVVKGYNDVLFARIHIPVCENLVSAIACIDTIKVTRTRKIVDPTRLDISVELTNPGSQESTQLLSGMLVLPEGIYLDPATQVLSVPGIVLQPGEMKVLRWTVRLDSSKNIPDAVNVNFYAYYSPASLGTTCPLPATISNHHIHVVTIADEEPLLACSASSPHIRLNGTGSGYEQNPFRIAYVLRNIGPKTVRIESIVLVLPRGMGLTTVPVGDNVRIGKVVPSGDLLNLEWTLRALQLQGPRTVTISMRAYDSYGVLVSTCSYELQFPPFNALLCSGSGTSSISYESSSNTTIPAIVEASLRLENPLDTLQTGIEAEILFDRATHLTLAAGETSLKGPLFITQRFRRDIQWLLAIKPPVTGVCADTLILRYRSALHPEWLYCETAIKIVPLSSEIFCMLSTSDSLTIEAGGHGYVPNPFAVTAEVSNSGNADARNIVTSLHLPNGITTSDDTWRSISLLRSGSKERWNWNLISGTSRYASNREILLKVLDSTGAVVTVCVKRVFHPAISDDLTCALAIPESIHYELITDFHTPNPFTASLTLGNVLDTAHQLIETEIDLSSAPHLALAAGEQARKDIAGIAAHGSETVDWTLTILPPITANVTERISVRYRHAGDTAWKQCERSILIEGAVRITAATCSSMGHDTVWADAGYEAIIPHPVQVQYTITNTGNVPLAGCSAAIVHSPMYALVNPADSILSYPVVQPGASASREWLLDPLLDHVQPLPEIISWVWSCDKLTVTPTCTHSITLVAASSAAVVFTPWLLRFQAERNGPLPAAQELRLWTGGAASMPWQLQSSTAWIDWQPSSGTDSARVMVVPNTTALLEGSHVGRIDMTAVPGVSPVGVRIVYDITTKTGIDEAVVPVTTMLGQNYPNPAGGYTTITATMDRQAKARLFIYDAYGRIVVVVHDGDLPAGRSSFQIDTKLLPSGMYWYSLVAGGRAEARMMMVVKR